MIDQWGKTFAIFKVRLSIFTIVRMCASVEHPKSPSMMNAVRRFNSCFVDIRTPTFNGNELWVPLKTHLQDCGATFYKQKMYVIATRSVRGHETVVCAMCWLVHRIAAAFRLTRLVGGDLRTVQEVVVSSLYLPQRSANGSHTVIFGFTFGWKNGDNWPSIMKLGWGKGSVLFRNVQMGLEINVEDS